MTCKICAFCNLLVFFMAMYMTNFCKCLVEIYESSMLTLLFRFSKPLLVFVCLINFERSIFKPLTMAVFFYHAFLVLLCFILLYFVICCLMHVSLWLLCVLCQFYILPFSICQIFLFNSFGP